jgi:hypothetical protein
MERPIWILFSARDRLSCWASVLIAQKDTPLSPAVTERHQCRSESKTRLGSWARNRLFRFHKLSISQSNFGKVQRRRKPSNTNSEYRSQTKGRTQAFQRGPDFARMLWMYHLCRSINTRPSDLLTRHAVQPMGQHLTRTFIDLCSFTSNKGSRLEPKAL